MHLLERAQWSCQSPEKYKVLVFFCFFSQPGCVNTTEVDIKKSSRMKNPHKTRKVERARCSGAAGVVGVVADLSSASVCLRAAERHPYPQPDSRSCPRSQTAHRRRATGAGECQLTLVTMSQTMLEKGDCSFHLCFQITFWQLQLDRHRLKMSKVAER